MTNRENILLVSLELRSLHENEFCFNSHSNAHVNCCPLLQYVIKQSFSSALSLVTKNSPNCLNFVLIYNAQCGVLIKIWTEFQWKILKALPRMLLLFFHRHPSGQWMFPDRPLPVSSNCATAPWLPEGIMGDFVTPFVLERLFDHSCFWWACRFILGACPLQVLESLSRT